MKIEQTNAENMPIYEQQKQFFDNVIKQLKDLYQLIKETSYVKRSAQILSIIIDDIKQPKKVLVLSSDSERQATFINNQLQRPLMPLLLEKGAVVSVSIIRAGLEERLDAHFLDGQVASFDLRHLALFTSMASEGAHLLQEALDYVDVFLNEHLLEHVSLIDVPAMSKEHALFIPPSVLRRADDIYWLLEEIDMTPSEKRLLKRLSKMGFQPLAISKEPLTIEESPFRAVIAESDTAKIQETLLENEQYNKIRIVKLADRLLQWLERFYTEISNLLQRDPYLEARQQLEREITQLEQVPSHDSEEFDALKQRAGRVVTQYMNAQTLYQVVQFIKHQSFIKEHILLEFVTVSNDYLEAVHYYRRVQQQYNEVKVELETLERKSRSKLMLNLFTKEHNERLQRIRAELPVIRAQMLDAYKRTKRREEAVIEALPLIAQRLQEVVNAELASLSERVEAINYAVPNGPTKRFKAIHRLKRFDGLCEAQALLNQFLPTIVPMTKQYLDAKQQLRLQASIANIASLPLDYVKVIEEALQLPEIVATNYTLSQTVVDAFPLTIESLQLTVEKPVI
ncbi:hypothetical protein [Kurthia sp. Dielmo]|uniref:hypothetical protein n=1 Tax=Kurthia sp. Dielmo TaxID=1033738 RepID=UPI00111EE1E4|nr:hypothetical protein [Kurthia sp. Dielmo]